ncbi:MAG: hypothetical protein FWD17_19590 [Polyangiaceae bacterium]|nr:hypothetical protein [Polyangiaceae bacterium]
MRSMAPVVCLLSFACGAAAGDGSLRPAADPRLAIAAIKTRDSKITWFAGQTFQIEDARGTVIADSVTTGDLERIDPFLHAACTQGLAGPYLDPRGPSPAVP